MKRPEKALVDSMRFQLSLVRLAVVPHGNQEENFGADAAVELAKLAKVLEPKPRRRAQHRTGA